MHEWPGQDSNLRTTDYESAALTTELRGRAGEASGLSRKYARIRGASGGAWRRPRTLMWQSHTAGPASLPATPAAPLGADRTYVRDHYGACVRRTGMIPRDVDRCRPAWPRPLDQLIRRDARPGVDVHRRWRDRQRVDRLRGRASDGRAPAEP